jgi:hypothetical protein
MKNLYLAFLLFACNAYSQSELNGVKFFLTQESKTTIYEGEFINLGYCIKNTSNDSRGLDINTSAFIKEIKLNGKVLEKHKPHSQLDAPDIASLSFPVSQPMQGGDSSCKFLSPRVYEYGQKRLRDYLNISEKDAAILNTDVLPLFLPPGEYEITLQLLSDSEYKNLILPVKFTVLPATGNSSLELNQYLSALYKGIISKEINALISADNSSLLGFIKNNPNSIYSDEALRLIGYEFKYGNFRQLQTKPDYILQVQDLLQLASTIKELPAPVGISLFTYHSAALPKIASMSSSGTLFAYLDSLLKNLADNSPFISESIIKMAEKEFDVQGLTNYSK